MNYVGLYLIPVKNDAEGGFLGYEGLKLMNYC